MMQFKVYTTTTQLKKKNLIGFLGQINYTVRFFVVVLKDIVLLYSLGWPGTPKADQTGTRDSSVSTLHAY